VPDYQVKSCRGRQSLTAIGEPMNKIEAAEYLECSVRAVERYVSSGKLAARYERGKTGQVLVLDETELERFKAELNAPVQRGTVGFDNARQSAPQVPTSAAAAASATTPDKSDSKALARLDGGSAGASMGENAALVRALYALAQLAPASVDKARQEPTVPTENKLLLSLAEAQALTGLSRETLRAAIAAGELAARQIGRGWKIKRRDLESYIENL